jgi:predicted enzyme related to lactoylglutathione lyase
MDLHVDHVTVAGTDLDRLTDAFTEAGLEVAYGGHHSNDITHMSLVGFPDGSYIELVSTIEPDMDSPWWDEPIHGDGGPCAWAIAVEDIEATTAELERRGVDVEGPSAYRRVREDGTVVEWDLTFLGVGEPGASLPFLISDRTPRERRVRPTGDPTSSSIVGVETVVLGVDDLEAAIEEFETVFGLSAPTTRELTDPSADVAVFPDQPVALARPRGEGWFADRLEAFGPLPVAYLLGRERGTEPRFDDRTAGFLGDRRIEWLPVTEPVGHRYLGLLEVTREG